jgi:hypothetical protein
MPRLSLVGLLASVFILMAVSAGPAQAEKGNVWLLNGEHVTSTLQPAVSVSSVGGLVLLSKVNGIKIEISCGGAALENTKLLTGGSVAGGKVKFTGCSTKLNEIKQVSCEPHNGTEKGVIVSNELNDSLVLHSGALFVRLEAASEILATVVSSEECLAGEKIAVIGKLTLKDEALEKESPSHSVSEGPLTELWLVSKTEEHKATMDGSLTLEMGGEHKGLEWAVSQADADWRVKGVSLTTLSPEVVAEAEKGGLTFLSKVIGVKFELSCNSMLMIGVKLQAEGKIATGAKLKFQGCTTKLNGTISKACEPNNGGVEPGVWVTKELKGLLALRKSVPVVRFVPSSGEVLTTWEFSKECAIFTKASLIGIISLKAIELTTEVELHLFEGGSFGDLWLISKTAEHETSIDGSAIFRLFFPHSGMPWSGVPG